MSYSYSCSLSWREDSSTECLPSKLVVDVKKLNLHSDIKTWNSSFLKTITKQKHMLPNKAKEFKKSLLVRRTNS